MNIEEEISLIQNTNKEKLIDTKEHKEPQSLKDKNIINLNPFNMCLNESFEKSFEQDELSVFYDLVTESNKPFNIENSNHCYMLKKLYKIVFKQEISVEDALEKKEWKMIGFQNNKPSTDFRGGGLLSLKCLLSFCEKEEELLGDIIDFSEKYHNYLFACVLISSVFFLKKFFHFGVYSQYQKSLDFKDLSSRAAVKYFLNLQTKKTVESSFQSFVDLIIFYNKKVYLLWKISFISNRNLRIIDFKQVEEIIKENFVIAFERVAKLEIFEKGNDLNTFYKIFNELPIKRTIKPYVF